MIEHSRSSLNRPLLLGIMAIGVALVFGTPGFFGLGAPFQAKQAFAQIIEHGLGTSKGCTSPLNIGGTIDCTSTALYIDNAANSTLGDHAIITAAHDCQSNVPVGSGGTPFNDDNLNCPAGSTGIHVHIISISGNAVCTTVTTDALHPAGLDFPCVVGNPGDSSTVNGLTLPGAISAGQVRVETDNIDNTSTPFTVASATSSTLKYRDDITWKFSDDCVYSDANNIACNTDTQIKPSIGLTSVNKSPPTITTSANPTGNPIVPVNNPQDNATVSGTGPTPTGTVTFKLNDTTTNTIVFTSSAISLVNGKASTPSTTTTINNFDTYCWDVSYSGDGNYTAGTALGARDSENECFTPVKLTPPIFTQSNVTGTPLIPVVNPADTITVNAVAPGGVPTGLINATLVDTTTNTVVFQGSGASLVNGQATTASGITITNFDTYCWNAQYYGDTTYNANSTVGLTDDPQNECFTPMGTPHLTLVKTVDNAKIENITFVLGVNSSKAVEYEFNVTNDGQLPVSGTTVNEFAVNNPATQAACDTNSPPTAQGSTSLAVGGSVVFTCTHTFVISNPTNGASSLDGCTPNPPNYHAFTNMANATGIAPDQSTVTSNNDTATVNVNCVPPTFTIQTQSSVTGNATINIVNPHDNVTITQSPAGAPVPTGTVVFKLNDTTTNTINYTSGSIALVNGKASTPSTTTTIDSSHVGHLMCWDVVYSGDSNYTSATQYGSGDRSHECFTPQQANFQGLTPGFWKANAINWGHGAWTPPYVPSTTFASAFGCTVPGQSSSLTLLQALQLQGGGNKALARQAVAALLNAALPDNVLNYPYTVAQVKTMVCNAYASGATAVNTLEAQLDTINNQESTNTISQHYKAF